MPTRTRSPPRTSPRIGASGELYCPPTPPAWVSSDPWFTSNIHRNASASPRALMDWARLMSLETARSEGLMTMLLSPDVMRLSLQMHGPSAKNRSKPTPPARMVLSWL